MIDPGEIIWWGKATMAVKGNSDEPRNARLLGIAIMITMPPDMVDENL